MLTKRMMHKRFITIITFYQALIKSHQKKKGIMWFILRFDNFRLDIDNILSIYYHFITITGRGGVYIEPIEGGPSLPKNVII